MPPGPTRRAFISQLGWAVAGSVVLVPPVPAASQRQHRADPFRAGVELVTVPVTVVDEDGRLVVGLHRDVFGVFDDGVFQPLRQFSSTRVPVSVCLALDVSDSMAGQRLEDARSAILRFVDELLAPDDEVALATFNHRPQLVSGWGSTDRSELRDRLDEVRPWGGTAIYDTVAAMLPVFRQRKHTRAAMVLVSDGADTASDTTLIELRPLLLRSDAFVYAIAVDAPDARASTRVNPWALRDISGPSGGYTEVIADSAELADATSRIADELNHQYVLAYSPNRPPDGQYHTIRVTVAGGNYRVRARRGYVAEIAGR